MAPVRILMSSADSHQQTDPAVGLCSACRHGRRVESARGSLFWLCERSFDEAEYPRYPRLPVTECAGFAAGRNEKKAPPG